MGFFAKLHSDALRWLANLPGGVDGKLFMCLNDLFSLAWSGLWGERGGRRPARPGQARPEPLCFSRCVVQVVVLLLLPIFLAGWQNFSNYSSVLNGKLCCCRSCVYVCACGSLGIP